MHMYNTICRCAPNYSFKPHSEELFSTLAVLTDVGLTHQIVFTMTPDSRTAGGRTSREITQQSIDVPTACGDSEMMVSAVSFTLSLLKIWLLDLKKNLQVKFNNSTSDSKTAYFHYHQSITEYFI